MSDVLGLLSVLLCTHAGNAQHAAEECIGARAQNTFVGQAMSMFGIVLVLLLASRAVFVFPIMALHNLWSSEKLPLRQIIVAWCAMCP